MDKVRCGLAGLCGGQWRINDVLRAGPVRIFTTSARLKTESKLGNNLQFENERVALGLRGVGKRSKFSFNIIGVDVFLHKVAAFNISFI